MPGTKRSRDEGTELAREIETNESEVTHVIDTGIATHEGGASRQQLEQDDAERVDSAAGPVWSPRDAGPDRSCSDRGRDRRTTMSGRSMVECQPPVTHRQRIRHF